MLGPHGAIEVQDGGRDLGHEFFLGSHWESKVPSNIVFDGIIGERIELKNTAWLISDFELDDLQALVKLVTDVYQAGYASLVIVAKSFSEQIIAAQGANSRMEDFRLVYLEPTGLVDEQEAALEDLALITGGGCCGRSPGTAWTRSRATCWALPSWLGSIAIASASSLVAGATRTRSARDRGAGSALRATAMTNDS